MILYFPYHPETHFIKIDTVFSAISYRQSQLTNPTSPQVFIISLWVPPDSTCMDWSKVVKWCSNSVFVGRCWMASRWIPSHPIPRSSNVTHPAWAKFWVCVSCSESFTLASSFCKPWSTLFLQGGFGREFVRKGNSIRLEVGFFKLMGDRILFIVKKTVSNLQLVGKHQCFCGHHSLFFRHCHSSTVVSSIQCNFFCAVWPLTKNTSIMMHYAHTHSSTPSTTKEHPHSLGFTVSSKHWIPKVCSNVVDLAPALVQQQSVRGILGACGWLFVAQWHFLSSREAWFSMTRIASQEHRSHKETAHGTHHHLFKSCHMTSNIIKASSQTSSHHFFNVSYPPTPLPCLRGRRKGRTKHCPWQHRSCGQPMHVFVHPRHTFDPCIHTSHATFHVFCPPTGAQGSVFGLPELGFRWSLGFSHPAALSAASGRLANAPFLAVLGSDLGGVWLFRIHCWRASFLFLFRLGCATVFVYPLRPFTSP